MPSEMTAAEALAFLGSLHVHDGESAEQYRAALAVLRLEILEARYPPGVLSEAQIREALEDHLEIDCYSFCYGGSVSSQSMSEAVAALLEAQRQNAGAEGGGSGDD